jgi:proteasome lid subunit RPN8/RPN11
MIEPIPKPAPSQTTALPRGAIGTIYRDALPIFIHEPVLEDILDYSEQDSGRELGGFLLGGLHVDETEYVEIRHFLPAVDARSRAASLTFTHDTWAKLTRDVDAQFPDEVVLGWHHTHPNFGIFLSAYDLFIHRNFFNEPWQVALVVDPQRQEFGFFQWRQGDVVDCGFVCIPE